MKNNIHGMGQFKFVEIDSFFFMIHFLLGSTSNSESLTQKLIFTKKAKSFRLEQIKIEIGMKSRSWTNA